MNSDRAACRAPRKVDALREAAEEAVGAIRGFLLMHLEQLEREKQPLAGATLAQVVGELQTMASNLDAALGGAGEGAMPAPALDTEAVRETAAWLRRLSEAPTLGQQALLRPGVGGGFAESVAVHHEKLLREAERLDEALGGAGKQAEALPVRPEEVTRPTGDHGVEEPTFAETLAMVGMEPLPEWPDGYDEAEHQEEDRGPQRGCCMPDRCLCPHVDHGPDECFDVAMAEAHADDGWAGEPAPPRPALAPYERFADDRTGEVLHRSRPDPPGRSVKPPRVGPGDLPEAPEAPTMRPAHDAPEGMCWQCPNCPSWATLLENAHAHALATRHGMASLAVRPAAESEEPVGSAGLHDLIRRLAREEIAVNNAARREEPDSDQERKVRELILCIANAFKSEGGVEMTKLRWIMFRADFAAYRERGRSITGGTWYKTEAGPELVLDNGQPTFGEFVPPDATVIGEMMDPDTAEGQNATERPIKLYLVNFDGESRYVEARSMPEAQRIWLTAMRDEWESDWTGDEEPDQILCVHDEPVIRSPLLAAIARAEKGGVE